MAFLGQQVHAGFKRGTCNICGVPAWLSKTGRLVPDHNHKTMVIRGLLCDPCNGKLAYLERNPDWDSEWVRDYRPIIESHLQSNVGTWGNGGRLRFKKRMLRLHGSDAT